MDRLQQHGSTSGLIEARAQPVSRSIPSYSGKMVCGRTGDVINCVWDRNHRVARVCTSCTSCRGIPRAGTGQAWQAECAGQAKRTSVLGLVAAARTGILRTRARAALLCWAHRRGCNREPVTHACMAATAGKQVAKTHFNKQHAGLILPGRCHRLLVVRGMWRQHPGSTKEL